MSGKRKSVSKHTEREILVRCLSGAWRVALPGYTRHIKKWCNAAISPEHTGSLAIVLADDAMIQELNHTYRGKAKPTNVLSFNGSNGELGDIILAHETIAREAEEQGKIFLQHTAHLVVHGCLHLLDYDHETIRDARIMEARETEILSGLGFPNPYRSTHV